MRLIAAVLLAAVATASTPAAACGSFNCFGEALTDDAYPPGTPTLDPAVRETVRVRGGYGLSAAGFYNDPTLALARRAFRRPAYGYRFDAPPSVQAAGYFEPAPDSAPVVVYNPWGHTRREVHAHSAAAVRHAGPHADVK